jgi:hypothetical protein
MTDPCKTACQERDRIIHVAGNGQVLTMSDVERVIERLEFDPIDEDARSDAVRLIRFLAEIASPPPPAAVVGALL